MIDNSDPKNVKLDVKLTWPSLTSIDLTFDVTLLQPSVIAIDVEATTVHVSIVNPQNGGLQYLADVQMPAFHIAPQSDVTIKIPLMNVKLNNVAGLITALGSISNNMLMINNKADLTLHASVWPLPIHATMDKTMPVSASNINLGPVSAS